MLTGFCFPQNHLTELNAVLASTAGMMHFLGKFWRGFYPLLLVELTDANNKEVGQLCYGPRVAFPDQIKSKS